MNKSILKNYGINFYKQTNGEIKITSISPNLSIYMDKFVRQKTMLQDLITNINIKLVGNAIDPESKEWTVELGLQQYTGIIQNNMTFDLFIEDYYNQTLETFPLFDIKEILNSLLEFLD